MKAMPARVAMMNHADAILSPRRICSSERRCVSEGSKGPAWPLSFSAGCSETTRFSAEADGVPTTRSGLSSPASFLSLLLFSVMGTLLRGDPDRAGHDQGETHGPPDETLRNLTDAVQGEDPARIGFGLEGLHIGDEFLLLLRIDDAVGEHRHGAGSADHGLVDLARGRFVDLGGPPAVRHRSA